MLNGHAAVRMCASPLHRLAVWANGTPSATADGWGKSLTTCLTLIHPLQRVHRRPPFPLLRRNRTMIQLWELQGPPLRMPTGIISHPTSHQSSLLQRLSLTYANVTPWPWRTTFPPYITFPPPLLISRCCACKGFLQTPLMGRLGILHRMVVG